jgi:peptide/nickel transport system substrate-binding protein
MKKLLGSLALGAALAIAPAAYAETPANALVMAMNIDDIISLDPAETFELVGGEVNANIYDRITGYEPGTMALVGAVAESWDIADDGHTIILHIREGQTFHSGNPLTAADVAFSLQRVIKLDKTPAFIFTQFGWTPDNVEQMVTATDDLTVTLSIPEALAPTLVLNCLAAGVGSVVDQKVALEHEQDGDFGYEWLKTNSAASGPFALRSWKPNESVTLDAQESRYGMPAMERVIIRHVPEAGAQRLLIEKGDADIARNLTTDQVAGLEGNADIRIQTDPKALSLHRRGATPP